MKEVQVLCSLSELRGSHITQQCIFLRVAGGGLCREYSPLSALSQSQGHPTIQVCAELSTLYDSTYHTIGTLPVS